MLNVGREVILSSNNDDARIQQLEKQVNLKKPDNLVLFQPARNEEQFFFEKTKISGAKVSLLWN